MLMDNNQDDLERQKTATVSVGSTPTMTSAATAPQLSSLKRVQTPMSEMESTISHLLTLTKRFLEALTSWSLGKMQNEQVMATYQELAEQFERVKAALQSAQLSISNVAHIPDELHKCLTAALANAPSKAVLEEHLPAIREIILRLLQSLKQKQSQLRDAPTPPSRRTSGSSTSSSRTSSPRAVQQRRSDLDMSDVSTRDALAVLNQQDNLARRSSVRRAGKSSPVTPPRRQQLLRQDLCHEAEEKKAVDLSAAFPLFLQVGDQVKKVMWHQPVTLAALRMAFRDKFGAGHDTAVIRIQDPVSRIMYELEDMSDVGPHCLIALASQDNVSISAKLDWIRQELQAQGRQRQPGRAKMDSTVVQQQQEQVDHLRRDLSVLRQVAQEFQQETSALLQELKLKQHEQQQKNSRHYLDETKLQAERVANAITGRLQDLQDTIDQLKLDVTQRRCRPSSSQLEHCSAQVNGLESDIDGLAQLLRTAKPQWKLTWEQELQQVVTEQQFLKEQEGLLLDLRDDHADLVHVLQQLEKISEIQARGSKKAIPLLFRGGGGEEGMSSVLKQVSTIDVDHQKRVKALQQAEKMRARELANRIDDFEKELSTFVEAKKLKRTGGAGHADRQRQKKDQQILRDLYQSKTHNNNNNNNNE